MTRPASRTWLVGMGLLWLFTVGLAIGRERFEDREDKKTKKITQDPVQNAADKVKRGRDIFRFDTFGDQAFWGDTLKLHQAIEGARLGGVGPGVSPRTALAVGLFECGPWRDGCVQRQWQPQVNRHPMLVLPFNGR